MASFWSVGRDRGWACLIYTNQTEVRSIPRARNGDVMTYLDVFEWVAHHSDEHVNEDDDDDDVIDTKHISAHGLDYRRAAVHERRAPYGGSVNCNGKYELCIMHSILFASNISACINIDAICFISYSFKLRRSTLMVWCVID